jgi:hypothetical protein
MKKLLFLALATITLSLTANAQDEKFPEGFIDKSLTEAEGYTAWIPELYVCDGAQRARPNPDRQVDGTC